MARNPPRAGRPQNPTFLPPINLKAWRLHAGLTQAELAARVNVTVTTVSRWETGERTPSLATISKIAEIYGVPEFRLQGRPDQPSLDAMIADSPASVREAVTAAAMDAYRKATRPS